MSAILLPLVAAGGIYLAVDAFTRKNRKSSKDTSTTTTTKSSTEKDSKPDSSTQKAPLKAKRKHRSLANKKPEELFSLIKGHRKTKKNVEKETRKLFVFYSFGEKNKDWDYKSLPSTWKMKRRVLSVNRTTNYNNVDVFTGEKRYQEQMRNYLEKAFSQLKANEIVKEYKIRGINAPV
jgi:hypothetical protein